MPRLPLAALLTLAACIAPGERTRAVNVYYGRQVENSLPEELILFQDLDPVDVYLGVVSYAQTVYRSSERWQWEIEGNLARNFQDQDNWEFNVAGLVRWQDFPWNETVRTSFAGGSGLSAASKIPVIEDAGEPETGTNELLYFLLLELELAAPSWKHWSTIFRVHHRSGIFGVFDGVSGGSNVLAAGLKFSW